MLEAQIAEIKEKLALVKSLDKNCELFGAERHRYELNEPLKAEEIEDFEKRNRIFLPDGYRRFLSEIGDGGAGPYYGIVKLEDSLFSDMEYKEKFGKVQPFLPFPHTEPQYMYAERSESSGAFDEEKFYERWTDPKHEQGILRICNYGCGVFIDLIVNGEEYGNIWISDITNEAGIFPVGIIEDEPERKMSFLEWYDLWLNKCFEEMELTENE